MVILQPAVSHAIKRLELGAGPFPQPGYDTLDGQDWREAYQNGVKPADIARIYIHDVEQDVAWPVESNYYDEILSIHMVEHINRERVQHMFHEAYRVLKPGGVMRIHVPNGPVIARAYLEIPDRREGLQICFYGLPGFHETHRCLYDQSLLGRLFEGAGFSFDKVRDVTNCPEFHDRHDVGWAPLFGDFGWMSLKMLAHK